ncbi:unnamed protein product, partial [Closterium sp. Yama58-4]
MDRGGGPTRVLRAQQPLQHSLVVTVSVIMTACLALMYMLVSRHLASMDQIALALTESMRLPCIAACACHASQHAPAMHRSMRLPCIAACACHASQHAPAMHRSMRLPCIAACACHASQHAPAMHRSMRLPCIAACACHASQHAPAMHRSMRLPCIAACACHASQHAPAMHRSRSTRLAALCLALPLALCPSSHAPSSPLSLGIPMRCRAPLPPRGSISEQTTNQAVELKALVAALENHTYSVAAAVTDHVAVQTVQLRQLAAELRNHSHFVREHVGQHVDAQQAQLAQVLAEVRARMGEVASAVMAPPAPPLPDSSAITPSNLTLLVAAGLRSQRRTEQAVGKLVTAVGRLAARDDEEGGLGTETLREVVSAVKKHMQLSRSLQSAVEGLAERVDAQAQLKGGEATPQEEKILAVLKALVAHLRAKEKAGLSDALLQGQRRMEGVVGALVGEVRNKTAFLSLLRAVRAQTAIVAKLGTRIASLETRVLPSTSLPAAALATADATALAASAAGAGGAGGVGAGEASVVVAAVTETQTGMAVVVREVQRQSEAVAELQAMLEASRGADMLQLAHKTHEALHDLVLAVRQQGKLLVSLDDRLAHMEAHVGGGGAGQADGDVARLERAVAAEAQGGGDVLQAAEAHTSMCTSTRPCAQAHVHVHKHTSMCTSMHHARATLTYTMHVLLSPTPCACCSHLHHARAAHTYTMRVLLSPTPCTCCSHLHHARAALTYTMHVLLSPTPCACCSHLHHARAALTYTMHVLLSPTPCTCCSHLHHARAALTYTMHVLLSPTPCTCCSHLHHARAALTMHVLLSLYASPLLYASKWSQHAFAGSPSFTRFSGYRMGARKLAAVGFGPTDLQHTRTVGKCSWQASEGVLPCVAGITYSLSANPGRNQEMLVTAAFDADVPNTGGHLTIAIDGQPFVLYSERASEHGALDPPLDLAVEVQVCALPPDPAHPAPLHSLHEFLEFYRLSGAARVVLYDNGAWQQGGMAEQVAGRCSAARWWWCRSMAAVTMTCTARARWVVPAELNEFLFTGSQPAALPAFLRAHSEAAVVTVGSLWWSTNKCSLDFPAGEQGGGKFWMERMVFRWPWPVCHDTTAFPDANLCLGETGYRKPIVDPRKVEVVGAFEARAGGGEGAEVDVRTEEAVYNHLQDLFNDPSLWCSELFNDDQGPEWWVRDTFLRDYAHSLRAGRVCDFDKGQ